MWRGLKSGWWTTRTISAAGMSAGVEIPAIPASLVATLAIVVAPPAAGAAIREIPLEQGMQLAARGLGAPVTAVQCRDCGATVNVGAGERTTKCAFCGSQTVLQGAANESAIRPESLVPFGIAKEAA